MKFRSVFPRIWYVLLLFAPPLVFACPLCDSDTAEEVRASLITTSIDGTTLPALMLPFVALAIVLLNIHFEWHENLIQKLKAIF